MNMTSIGDLAQSLMLRHRSTQIRQTISTLSNELSSGQVSDVAGRLAGDFSYLTDIDRNLTRLGGFSVAASEAALFADASQKSVERLHELTSSLSNTLLSLNPIVLEPVKRNLSLQASEDLKSALSALNASAGGRTLFAGTATDRSPMATADDLLNALRPLVTGLGSAALVEAAVDTWFSDPAGFKAVMYSGADQTLAPIQIGAGEEVTLTLKAEDQEFRDALKNLALVALAGESGLGFSGATQRDLFVAAGDGLLISQGELAGVRADLGFAQARIQEVSVRNASARSGLEYARGSLLQADAFDTATRLEEAQFQLESLYAVTVRSSKLSLMNFMR
ncbi:flagellar biosynthesis protein FlgL [Sedimentitalea sp. HM32M-2]|uniref:flagellar biosynthesis protein FlgL n=1 Tax=Sedimentitalea sp. HM32M-2 TaxID=3351566 RepID=UPI00362D9834